MFTTTTVKGYDIKSGDFVKNIDGFFVEITGVDFGGFGRVYLGVDGEACYKGIEVKGSADIEILATK